jgi:hypothetical protein
MTEKKVDESWKDNVAHEKLDAEREEPKQERQPQGDAAGREQEQDTAQSADEPTGFPPIQAGFITLVADLAMQASLFMGEIPDPETNEPIEDLNRAKYLIDELGMLEEKTKGNLTPEEAGALKNVLYELRMKFVAKAPKS